MLHNSLSWLASTLAEKAGETVTYTRAAASVSLSAVVGRQRREGDGVETLTVDGNSRDFLIRAADLILSGSAAKPLRGDTITEASGREYEVTDWRYSDAACLVYRVSTVRITDA